MHVRFLSKSLPVGRVFCIGMNYAEHIRELGSNTPDQPVVFMKPPQSIALSGKELNFPVHGKNLHFETELVLYIGKSGHVKTEAESLSFIKGLTVGFDLTLRDLQGELKKSGRPWEISKAFEDSAPLGDFVEYNSSIDIHAIDFAGYVNGQMRQQGNSSQMMFPVEKIVHYIGSIWKFIPGDIIFTGTPPGVGPLNKVDRISARCPTLSLDFAWKFH